MPAVSNTSIGRITVVTAQERHKYLGRSFYGELRNRGKAAVEHRLGCAWMKYNTLKDSLENRHINIRLRFRLFDAVVTAAAVYSLETCPLTSTLLSRVDATQRKMLRRMVGWSHLQGDSWAERGRLMKARLSRCLVLRPVESWSTQISKHKAYCCVRKSLGLSGRLLRMNGSPAPPAGVAGHLSSGMKRE